MTTNIYRTAAMILLATFVLFSCKKNDSVPAPTEKDYSAGATVTASFQGRITDQNGLPVNGCIVTAGTTTASTNINGKFNITGAQVAKDAGVIKVTKTGFFTNYRTVTLSENSKQYVEIQLIPKTASGTFVATAGGLINVSSGGNISFPSNSIVTESTNAAYTGTVTVSAFFMNPSDAAFSTYQPGELRGINANNNERLLKSFGMMLVELQGGAGEKLQLASGKTATITFPIITSLQASAPATIPLWYFDETQGLWKEQGTATRQGNNYAGSVSHFSFWNCDMALPLINFEALYKDQNGNAMPFTRVSFQRPDGEVRSGFTDSTGKLLAKLPANELLVMKVTDPCNNILFTQNVGPYNNDINAGNFTVTSNSATVTISGTAKTCSGAPLANGLVSISLDGTTNMASVINGNFSIQIQRCNSSTATATLTVFDTASSMQGLPVNVTVNAATVNAGQLSACGSSIQEYIYFTVGSQNYSWLPPASVSSDRTLGYNQGPTPVINATIVQGFSGSQLIDFKFEGATTPGTYSIYTLHFAANSVTGYNTTLGAGMPIVTVTEYGPIGGYVKGSFSTTLSTPSGLQPGYCSFRVKRNS